MSFLSFRRSAAATALRLGLVVATVGALTGCSAGGMGETGALLTGRTRLAALQTQPPAGKITVQMLPFSGLPVSIADSIYRKFRELAVDAKIELVHRLDEPATYRIQGHFVALASETSTVIIVTYDIFDATGLPIHRLVLQEVAGGNTGDYWNGVTGGTASLLAQRSVRELSAWLKGERR